MAFFRIKKIKGIEYAYLVKNRWTKKGARQKVGKYLGKLIRLEQTNPMEFEEYIKRDIKSFIEENEPEAIVNRIIEYELNIHGFGKDLKLGEIIYRNRGVVLNNKPVVLFLNEGYLCSYSIKDIFKFNYTGDETQTATALANVFVNAGLDVPQDLFVLFFQKIYKASSITRICL